MKSKQHFIKQIAVGHLFFVSVLSLVGCHPPRHNVIGLENQGSASTYNMVSIQASASDFNNNKTLVARTHVDF